MCTTRSLKKGTRDVLMFNKNESLNLLRYIKNLELIVQECDLIIQNKIYYVKHYAKFKVVEL